MTQKQQIQRQAVLTTAHQDYAKGLSVHAFFRVRDRVVGQDLVQDTFIKTWSYLAKGGKIELMKAFLYHVLNHLIVDEYRKHKTTSLDTLLEKGFEPSDGDFSRMFNVLDGKAAFLLIQRLPEKYKKVVRMKYMQDLSLKEMSLITGQSTGTMAVQVHRGLERLKLLYEHKV
jgi:RNA polymerase sigma-70 factor (ECF subfamily)